MERFSFIDAAIRHADFLSFGEPCHNPDQVRNALNVATEYGEYSTGAYVIHRAMTPDFSVYYTVTLTH